MTSEQASSFAQQANSYGQFGTYPQELSITLKENLEKRRAKLQKELDLIDAILADPASILAMTLQQLSNVSF